MSLNTDHMQIMCKSNMISKQIILHKRST